jgi:EmrB/QacA subfamily drug resistance transporter
MKNKIGINSKWLVLITVSIGSFMSGISSSMINISFPRLAEIFNTDASVVLWVTVAYLLVNTGLMAIVGKIGDIFGRKRVYILGLGIFTLGLILCAISQSILQLICFRVIQGVGGAIIIALSYAIVTATFGDEERGKALGILTAVGMSGPLVGPIISGIFLDALDWRSLFYLIIPLGIAGLIMSWLFLKEQKVLKTSPKIDYWGAGMLFGALGCLILFLNMGGRLGFTSPVILALITVSIILFVVFVIRELKIAYPVVDLGLFKNRVFALSTITRGLQGISLSGYIFITPFFLINGLGYSAWQAGTVYVIAPLSTALLAPLTGWLSDKITPRVLCTVGLALISGGFYLLSRFNADSTLLSMLPGLIVYGVGMALFNAPNANRIMGSVAKDKLGLASALMNTISQVGMSGGMAVFGLIYTARVAAKSLQLASQNLEPAVLQQLSVIGGFQDGILIAAIITGLGIFTSVFQPSTSGKNGNK